MGGRRGGREREGERDKDMCSCGTMVQPAVFTSVSRPVVVVTLCVCDCAAVAAPLSPHAVSTTELICLLKSCTTTHRHWHQCGTHCGN